MFAVLAEEFGLLGVLVVVFAFLVLMLRSLRLARIAADAGMPLHACIAAGFGVWIGLQAFLNMGVNLGLLPTKGLTLPLLSYGRSSMLVTLAWIGMLLRVHHEVVASGKSAIPAGRAPAVSRTVMIMAGGTGGHVFPALAIAEAAARHARHRLARHRARHRGAARAGRRLPGRVDRSRGPARQGPRSLAHGAGPAAARRRAGAAGARSGVARRRARLGGFASGPGGIAAWLAGAPLVIHEQNAVAGLTNRWLARVRRVHRRGLSGQLSGARQRAIYVGNPVRPEIAALPPPRQRFESRNGPMRLFVFGGSQGATALNRLVPAAVALLPESRRPWVLHQTGAKDRDATEAAYRAAGIQAEVRAFIDDMAAAYANADLVISRAGASTVAELAAVGVGADPRAVSRSGGRSPDPQCRVARARERGAGRVGNGPHGARAREPPGDAVRQRPLAAARHGRRGARRSP